MLGGEPGPHPLWPRFLSPPLPGPRPPFLTGSGGSDMGGDGWRDDAAEGVIVSSRSGRLELAGTQPRQMCVCVCGQQSHTLGGNGVVMS